MAVSVSLKNVRGVTKKCVEYVALGWTLKVWLGMNHTTRIQINQYEIKTYEISFNSLTATLFHSFVRKNVFTAKVFNMYIISMWLTPIYASMVELLCENHKKALL